MTMKVNGFDFQELRRETERREAVAAQPEPPVLQECCDCGSMCTPHKTFKDGAVWCLRCWFANTG